jgi:hypothetical protein
MGMTSRDKKILAVLAVLALVAGYWFLLLKPKQQEAADAAADVAEQQDRLDQAETLLASLEEARESYDRDYTTVVRLGKAIPSFVDTPSLMVQLQDAARGTGIKFDRIATGTREEEAAAPAAPPAESAPPPESTPPTDQAAAPATDTQTSQAATDGGLPVGGGAAPASGTEAAAGSTPPPALETVPLEFGFRGSFFDLADFFHRMKRFVHVANNQIRVSGRLMTVDGFSFVSTPDTFPTLTAEVFATVYASPKTEGVTAGATPEGPPETAPAAAPSDTASQPEPAPAAPAPPTAAASP